MQTLETILKRKSVRKFKSEQISEKDLEFILNSACAAPVGHGDYDSLWLTVIQNRDILNKISSKCSNSDIFYGAPTVIVISSTETRPLNYANSGCVAQNILLAATELEIGSVYVFQITKAFEDSQSFVEEILDISGEYTPIASVALGY